MRRALTAIFREKNVYRLPVIQTALVFLQKPNVPRARGAEAARVCGARPSGRDIAAFGETDALRSPGPAVLKSPPAGRLRPGQQSPRRIQARSRHYPGPRRLPGPEVLDPSWAAGPPRALEGLPSPSGGLLPAARPASPHGSPTPVPQPHSPRLPRNTENGPGCTFPCLGLSSPRCSYQRQTPEKTRTKKIRNSSTHP